LVAFPEEEARPTLETAVYTNGHVLAYLYFHGSIESADGIMDNIVPNGHILPCHPLG
jgi:hypothetical protein